MPQHAFNPDSPAQTTGADGHPLPPCHAAAQVVIQRDWRSWRTATVQMMDVEGVHWLQPKGAPRPLLHAYVCCTAIRSGDVPHDCQATPAPHRLLVCVLRRHVQADVFATLARSATPAESVPVGSGSQHPFQGRR
jgi:hypothetical protein